MYKVMIAEDEALAREDLTKRVRAILGDRAMLESCSNGNEAVELAMRFQPDLIFMDIEMPEKSGIEASQVIRRQSSHAKIVFLTAYDRFEYAVGALRAGAEDYLLKPISDTDLRETIRRFFGELQEESAPDDSPFVSALKVWIRSHYKEDVALDEAAKSMGMSSFYFSRRVRSETGKTFLEICTDYRLRKAKERLRFTNLSVTEIARSVGYQDLNYFTKVFKKAEGKTPSEYRADCSGQK